ncbi:hypothetical protein WAI453_010789 [Rhynchosporium graminicola]
MIAISLIPVWQALSSPLLSSPLLSSPLPSSPLPSPLFLSTWSPHLTSPQPKSTTAPPSSGTRSFKVARLLAYFAEPGDASIAARGRTTAGKTWYEGRPFQRLWNIYNRRRTCSYGVAGQGIA